ncbi:TPA: hypothetical protein JG871_003944 [Enterobacter hormaechei subsp. xiangfangensis]|nr:hypothetical protein [Enterobacter hormaechei subsp. xiangfangensis]
MNEKHHKCGEVLATSSTRRAAWTEINRDAFAFGDGMADGVQHLEWAAVFLDELAHFNGIKNMDI